MKLRFEAFGAIVATDDPPALVWVDRPLAAELAATAGLAGPGDAWRGADDASLSAPTEIHLMTTNRCPAGCAGCYTSATLASEDASTERVRRTLERIAAAGVFHVAMGGGESLLRDDLFDLAEYARQLGVVPNLTTSGIGMTPAVARRCRVFGQVNVSLDGLGDTYVASRGYDGEARALAAIEALAAAGVPVGANFVLSRVTYDGLEDTVARLDALGANEIEVLRFKPAGRGRAVYAQRRLTDAQVDGLLQKLLACAVAFPRVVMKVDCSLVPFVCATDPDPAVLDAFGIFGCEAGHALAAVDHTLAVLPCSFLPATSARADGPTDPMARGAWEGEPTLAAYRDHHRHAPEPCASCTYRTLCKGGCRAVALHVVGDAFAPDPECPRVVAHRSAAGVEPLASPLPLR